MRAMEDWVWSHVGGEGPHIYSVVSKGVSWANKGWDVLSCREKTAGLFVERPG